MGLGTPTSSGPGLPMAKGCQPLPTALDVIADPGCHKRAPLQPRSHVFGTSKSQRAQRGCPCASPDVTSLHVGSELVASCPHPTGSLEVKQASQVCRNSPDALVPIATCNPLPSSSLEPLQHPLTCSLPGVRCRSSCSNTDTVPWAGLSLAPQGRSLQGLEKGNMLRSEQCLARSHPHLLLRCLTHHLSHDRSQNHPDFDL